MAVEYGIITSVIPPGGWHYVQKLSSGQSHKIIGYSFEQLLDNILDFRRGHIELCGAESAYIEAVRADLKAYLCAHFRQNCADSPVMPQTGTGIVNSASSYNRPIDRAANWLAQIEAANWIAQIAGARPEFIDIGVAGARAQICAQCPQNVRWQTACAPCNETVEIRLQNFKGNLRTPFDNRLHMCRIFGHVNAAAVWLKDTQTTPISPQPAHCWH